MGTREVAADNPVNPVYRRPPAKLPEITFYGTPVVTIDKVDIAFIHSGPKDGFSFDFCILDSGITGIVASHQTSDNLDMT